MPRRFANSIDHLKTHWIRLTRVRFYNSAIRSSFRWNETLEKTETKISVACSDVCLFELDRNVTIRKISSFILRFLGRKKKRLNFEFRWSHSGLYSLPFYMRKSVKRGTRGRRYVKKKKSRHEKIVDFCLTGFLSSRQYAAGTMRISVGIQISLDAVTLSINLERLGKFHLQWASKLNK